MGHFFLRKPVILGLGLSSIALILMSSWAENIRNDALYTLFPSGDRAFRYAEMHFNSQDMRRYNAERSFFYFHEALQRNPRLPLIHHELARMYFLKGEYTQALQYIDMQLQLHPDTTPASHYVKALILGYLGEYQRSAIEYKIFLSHNPQDWAAVNDLAWVLLRHDKLSEAKEVIIATLSLWPDNPWLLNTLAVAEHRLGNTSQARQYLASALKSAQKLTVSDWLAAYPGNSPVLAPEGIQNLRSAIADNLAILKYK